MTHEHSWISLVGRQELGSTPPTSYFPLADASLTLNLTLGSLFPYYFYVVMGLVQKWIVMYVNFHVLLLYVWKLQKIIFYFLTIQTTTIQCFAK